MLAEEPGTYLLTDYLVRSFRRSVVAELGLDRYPELREDYFGHYRRVVWLAQEPSPELRAAAQDAAAFLGLPLSMVVVGDSGLERELARLLPVRGSCTHRAVPISRRGGGPTGPAASARSRRPG